MCNTDKKKKNIDYKCEKDTPELCYHLYFIFYRDKYFCQSHAKKVSYLFFLNPLFIKTRDKVKI